MSNKDQQNNDNASGDKKARKPGPLVVKHKSESPGVKSDGAPKAKRKPKAAPSPKPATPGPDKEIIEPSATPTNVMEVHHHPELEHKPKPFKEYLLEGFMIFIAVMMGFIAENIREGIDNNEQAKHLTTQLAQDLKADITHLDSVYTAEDAILKANDTLLTLLQAPLDKINTNKLQELVVTSHSMWPFHPAGGAIGAIKNQLNLKQFSDSKIISYIARYEQHIELIHTLQDITLLYQRTYLDPFLLQHFTAANLTSAFDEKGVVDGQVRNLSQNDITQLSADMVLIRINTRELCRDHRWLKNDAENLLRYLHEQYGVEE